MAAGLGRIEEISLGRTVIRIAGWLETTDVTGALAVSIDGVPADAEIFPRASSTARRVPFVAHVYGVRREQIASIAIIGPDRQTIGITAQTRSKHLKPMGFIDRITPELVTGWLYDPDLMPGETAVIEIEGLEPIPFVPLIDRQDVVAAGITPDPLVGFEVSLLPPPGKWRTPLDDRPRSIRLRSRDIVVAVGKASLQRRLEGRLTISGGNLLRGWLRDLDNLPGPIVADFVFAPSQVIRVSTASIAAPAAGDRLAIDCRLRSHHSGQDEPLPVLVHPHSGVSIDVLISDSVLDDRPATISASTARGSARPVATASTERPRILSVVAATGGGTPQTNLDLMRGLEAQFEPFVLSAAHDHLRLDRIVDGSLAEHDRWWLAEPVGPDCHDSNSYRTVVAELLAREAIDLVHIRHLAWHGLSLIACAKALGIPVVVSFHDYYTLCPSVKLLDERNRFCAGTCTVGRGPCRPELWPVQSLQPLKHDRVSTWRQRMQSALADADHLVTTSARAKTLMLGHMPALRCLPFDVIPHGRDFPDFARSTSPLRTGERLKVLALGSISPAKGAHILAALAEDPRIEVHVLGEAAAFLHTPSIVHHGSYSRDEVIERIAAIAPHVGLIASIWPETHCHTLTELWAAGIPVAAFDIGAVGERLAECGGGWLVSGTHPSDMLQTLLRLHGSPEEIAHVVAQVHRLQRMRLTAETSAWMAHRYATIYRRRLERASTPVAR